MKQVKLLTAGIVDVAFGAGAVVIRRIDHPGIYAGNPARFIRDLADRA